MKIISGGQTGVDRAALDVAIELGLDYGGILPKGRMTEEGPLPDRYTHCIENAAADYIKRTEMNVQQSDATLVLYVGVLEGGTEYTVQMIRKHRKPHLILDIQSMKFKEQVRTIRQFLRHRKPAVLNIAGPRESKQLGIYQSVYRLLHLLFSNQHHSITNR